MSIESRWDGFTDFSTAFIVCEDIIVEARRLRSSTLTGVRFMDDDTLVEKKESKACMD